MMFCSKSTALHTRGESLSLPPLLDDILLIEVTATNKVVPHLQSIRLLAFSLFSFFLSIQVTLEAAPPFLPSFNKKLSSLLQAKYLSWVLLKLNKTFNKHSQQLSFKKRSLIRFQLFQPLIWNIAQLGERFL